MSKSKPLFSAWDTRRRQVVRTFETVSSVGSLSPNGDTLLAYNAAGEKLLVNVRNGQIGRLPGLTEKRIGFVFSPDSQTLVHNDIETLEIWDVATGTKRGQARLGSGWAWFDSTVVISADSRVVCVHSEDRRPLIKAWSLDTGERLWPPLEPEPARNDGKVEFLERFGMLSLAEMSPKFTPDHRYLCSRVNGRIDMLAPSTGEPCVSIRMNRPASDPVILAFTPDGRTMLSRWDYAPRQQWFGEEWLAKLRPAPTLSFVVSDVGTGGEELRVNVQSPSSHARLSNDGRTLVTHTWHDEIPVISCWSVPCRPSRWFVVGIPTALGVGCLAISWWRAHRQRKVKTGNTTTNNTTANSATAAP